MRTAHCLFFLFSILGLALGACSGSPETLSDPAPDLGLAEERTLVLWTHEFPTFSDGLRDKWIPEFEAAHPGVRVEYEVFPYSGAIVTFDTKLLSDVFSGQGPDVWAMASHNFTQAQYLEAGLLAPLDPQLFGYDSVEDLLQDYPENSLSVFMRSGQIYGLLNELTTLCLYYNKEVFDQAGLAYPSETQPMSWEQIGALGPAVLQTEAASDTPTRMAYQFGFFANYPSPEWYVQNFYPIMRQYGQGDLFIDDRPAGDSQAVTDALQVFYDFTHVHRAYDPYFAQDWFSDFANDRIGMVTAGPWFTSAVRAQSPEIRFGVAPHPVVDPEDPAAYHNVMYSFGWVVNASIDPEQQALAQEFLAFILGKKGEAEQPLWWLEQVGVLQPRSAFLESDGFQQVLVQDPWLRCFIETFDTYQVDYYQHSSDEAGAALVRALNRVVYDQMDPTESARLLQQELLLIP
jgi:ABC-type glycerol-3-phosphate transport system substrate-binding protein